MSISLIAAKSENNVIGVDGKLPWHLPADLKHFKELTTGMPVIAGRKTFESILEMLGRPLPNRRSLVVTRNAEYAPEGAEVFHSLERAIAAAGGTAFVIGGAEIYRQALPLADTLYLPNVHTHVDGDAYFPDIDEREWRVTASETHERDEKNGYDYTFLTYERT